MVSFVIIAVLLTAIAAFAVVRPLLRQPEDTGAPVAAAVLGMALPAAVLITYVLVSNYRWGEEAAVAPQTPNAIAALEQRLQAEPDDPEGWLLLGQTYLQVQRIEEAGDAFRRALALEPSAEAKLGFAEAEIMRDRSTIAGEAGRLVEEVLIEQPMNGKALFYGGMAAMARQDMPLFKTRWQQLLQLSPPENIRNLIEEQLALAGGVEMPSGSEGKFSVAISIDPALLAKVRPGAALFLVGRAADRPGPPIAAVKSTANSLPATIEISDGNAMIPGRSLNDPDKVELIARVANGGDPVAKSGDLFGNVFWTRDMSDRNITIRIDQVVE